jgi:hypothetical protein
MDWPAIFFTGCVVGGCIGFMLGYIVYDDGR